MAAECQRYRTTTSSWCSVTCIVFPRDEQRGQHDNGDNLYPLCSGASVHSFSGCLARSLSVLMSRTHPASGRLPLPGHLIRTTRMVTVTDLCSHVIVCELSEVIVLR